MLSKIDIGNGLGCWKTIVTRRRSAVGSSVAMSVPSSVIRPLSDAGAGQLGEPVERAQQRRLAAAGRTDQREHLALADRQRHRPDRELLPVGDRHLVDVHPVDRRHDLALGALGGDQRRAVLLRRAPGRSSGAGAGAAWRLAGQDFNVVPGVSRRTGGGCLDSICVSSIEAPLSGGRRCRRSG